MACKNVTYDWPREATLVLIELYEGHPVLYLPTLPNYGNRNVRTRALQEIADEFNKRKFTNLSPDDIKKKLHVIRTQFLAEIQKIRKSEASGAGTDYLYTPKLWCFEQLHFLQQGAAVVSQGESNLGLSQLQRMEEPTQMGEETQEKLPEILYDGDVDFINETEIDMMSPTSSARRVSRGPSTSRTPSRGEEEPEPKVNKKRKRAEKEEIGGLISNAVATLQSISNPTEQTKPARKHALFGEFVAEEMESLEDEEVVDELKEAIISSIFFSRRKQRALKK